MDIREAKFIPLELKVEDRSARACKTQNASKKDIEVVASHIFGQ
jgi:hypothetical protein